MSPHLPCSLLDFLTISIFVAQESVSQVQHDSTPGCSHHWGGSMFVVVFPLLLKCEPCVSSFFPSVFMIHVSCRCVSVSGACSLCTRSIVPFLVVSSFLLYSLTLRSGNVPPQLVFLEEAEELISGSSNGVVCRWRVQDQEGVYVSRTPCPALTCRTSLPFLIGDARVVVFLLVYRSECMCVFYDSVCVCVCVCASIYTYMCMYICMCVCFTVTYLDPSPFFVCSSAHRR